MKFSYLFVIPALLVSQVALADSDTVYKWKFVQNNEIKKLTFKNDEAAKNEATLRKVIGKGFAEEFCSTEKRLLKTHLKDMSKSCEIKEKEITDDTLTAQMVCEGTQNIKFRVRKQPEGHYEGISRVSIDNDDFTLQGYSMIKIKKSGECSEEEITKTKEKLAKKKSKKEE
jgi:hypothetical protein